MVKGKSYLELTVEFLEKIEKEQAENFKKAGQVIGDVLMKDQLLHVVGTGGHTDLPAYDMFYRAGGLVPINYIIPIGALYGASGATHGMRIERCPDYMNRVVDYYGVEKGDVAIIFNNIGVNAATIDAILECKKKGAYTIGVGGSPWQKEIPHDHFTRHPSRKNMMELVDLFIDDYNPVGDSVMEIDGFDRPFAPISAMTDGYIVRRMEIETIKYMVSKGVTPKVWMSANCVGGDQANAQYVKEYFHRIKNL
ncbi:MAG: sugar isomerase domain-containing protein [Candidatus Atribacteria bacterium]|nr:sugar isomerase domain-containing protein [Candidatus Atribacteria bacterium]